MTSGAVLAEVDNSTAWVVISNPPKRNAISTRMMSDLAATLRRLEQDTSVRAIVLRGAGTAAFAAGADISEFEAQQSTESARQVNDEAVAALFGTLATLTTPLIAMVHGHCLGAGMAIALGADMRFAAPDARFAIPAARLGIGYPLELTHALVETIGPGSAAEMLYTARAVSAVEALHMGLINAVVASDELESHIRSIAERIAVNAPLSISAAKASIKAHGDATLVSQAQRLVAHCSDSSDIREGQRAFMERRNPQFEGR